MIECDSGVDAGGTTADIACSCTALLKREIVFVGRRHWKMTYCAEYR
jgi:hypothetical protein